MLSHLASTELAVFSLESFLTRLLTFYSQALYRLSYTRILATINAGCPRNNINKLRSRVVKSSNWLEIAGFGPVKVPSNSISFFCFTKISLYGRELTSRTGLLRVERRL